jgi:hypothetical protein
MTFVSKQPRAWTTPCTLGPIVAILLALSIYHSYALGQHRTMYDNPVYRWRESLAIALSRMRDKPLHGYLAYHSIQSYLAKNGLGLMAGEVDHLPTGEERAKLVFDGPRMQALIEAASRIPIDESLPPVTLKGNEKGLADYYYLAFELFGLNIRALTQFYYFILSISAIIFFLTFRRSPFCILLLMLFLATHFYMVEYASHPYISTVHNSRFLPVLALVPSMHLLLLVLRSEPPTWSIITMAAAQTLIVLFIMFCREEALWQALAVIASLFLFLRYRELWTEFRWPRAGSVAVKGTPPRVWPSLLMLAGLIGLYTYSAVALDSNYYKTESKTHVFWHVVYGAMVDASPELSKRYLYGEARHEDNMVYQAVLADVRARNDASSEVTYVEDGVIYINPMKDMGAYDRLVRGIFFRTVAEHPWLALKSFVYDKPRDQFTIFENANIFDLSHYTIVFVLAVGATIAVLLCGVSFPQRGELFLALQAVALVVAYSFVPILIAPSLYLCDVLTVFIMLALLLFVFLPLAAMASLLRSVVGARKK